MFCKHSLSVNYCDYIVSIMAHYMNTSLLPFDSLELGIAYSICGLVQNYIVD